MPSRRPAYNNRLGPLCDPTANIGRWLYRLQQTEAIKSIAFFPFHALFNRADQDTYNPARPLPIRQHYGQEPPHSVFEI